MKDLAGSAEEFASFSKDGGDNLVKAAVQARPWVYHYKIQQRYPKDY